MTRKGSFGNIIIIQTSRIPVDDGLIVARYGNITVSMVYRGHRVGSDVTDVMSLICRITEPAYKRPTPTHSASSPSNTRPSACGTH